MHLNLTLNKASTASPTTEDMSTNFLNLPNELRNRVYKLCLLHQEPIDPWSDYNQRLELTPGLLRANKTVHREASSLFYAQNRFNFTTVTPKDVASFLETIDRNACHIQHVCVTFPDFHRKPDNITLSDDSINIFTSIQSKCANLSTLTTFALSTGPIMAVDDPEIATEVLKLVDTRFRSIPSLEKIITSVFNDDLGSFITREMDNRCGRMWGGME